MLFASHEIKPHLVQASPVHFDGQDCLRVTKDPTVTEVDEPTFAQLVGPKFHGGTIEVAVRSRLLPDAPPHARGFIGVAFRILDDRTAFEGIYVRPTNGRANDQLRRNGTVQYFAYPDHKYDRLRREFPRQYETWADIGLDEWIRMRLEVRGRHVELFLNGSPRPAFLVSETFLEAPGALGLWVDVGTEGFFTDLRVTPQ